MSIASDAVLPSSPFTEVAAGLDQRTKEILEHRRNAGTRRRRGWVMRRMLLAADVAGLLAAFVAVESCFAWLTSNGGAGRSTYLVFFATLPGWAVLAKLDGLYDHDDERADHTTVDEVAAVFRAVTTGTWLYASIVWLSDVHELRFDKLLAFWLAAMALVTAARIGARAMCHHSISYLQNTVIVGAGEIGQLVARKVLHHPEYGLNVVGFVDDEPRERRADLAHLTLLGAPDQLPAIVRLLDVERVIVAFSRDSHQETLSLVRSIQDLGIQIDIVPRLFEIVGPNVEVHALEGLPLVGMPPARIGRSSMLLKRAFDVVAALIGLVLTGPLMLAIAIAVRRDSPGPALFRQTRLGLGQCEFTLLKFRTMKVSTDDAPHRAYIERLMTGEATSEENGLFKLDRESDVTRVGRWLRRTSLDELPQLINVLRGDMSLVGPRPCIPYETEHFAPHHFERFRVPAGITGLWQVTARAHTTFSEALDMDVAYARGWSTALDFTLVLRTVRHLFARTGTA